MKYEILDAGKRLVTLRFTQGTYELVRNFVVGDREMAGGVIESTQVLFLSKEIKDPAKLKQKLVELGPELKAEAEKLANELVC